ncbi:MAG: DUF445 domain-containing protein [Verrucomicrobiales bacterium]
MIDGKAKLRRMRRWATALLVLMAVLFVLAKSGEAGRPWLAWVRAFAEAGMVGALADWFAVTALFRHPLGLPIPHTAIVRKEKERIGEVLAKFMRGNFLSPEVVRAQWREREPLRRGLEWLAADENAGAVRRGLEAGWRSVRRVLAGEEFAARAGRVMRESVRDLPFERWGAVLLRGFLASESRRAVMAPVLGRLAAAVEGNREYVMWEAGQEAPLREKKVLGAFTTAMTRVFSGKAVEKVGARLREAAEDETHPLYDRIEESLRQVERELVAGGEVVAAWGDFRERLLADPETGALARRVFEGALRLIEEEWVAGERGQAVEIIQGAARDFLERDDFGEWSERAGEWLAGALERHGGFLERWVKRVVDGWEAEELIDRLESQVGADLQFIRINGTLIGGTVGVLLHALSGWLF